LDFSASTGTGFSNFFSAWLKLIACNFSVFNAQFESLEIEKRDWLAGEKLGLA